MAINLPRVSDLLYVKNDNEIWQYFSGETILNNFQVTSLNPFTVESNGTNYLLTSDKDFVGGDGVDYVLLTSKKPTRTNLNANRIVFKRWLKHPDFLNLTPEQVTSTWKGKFKFIKENEAEEIKGLRPPQIGALYSILAHIQNPEDKAIVVMPLVQERQKQCWQP